MFHWFGTITNTKGDSQSGWQVECVQLDDGETVVPIFADENSTPILTVSGVADRAVTDANGNYDFFVASGTYSLRFYDEAGEFQRLQRYLPMYGDTTAETAANLLAAQAAESAAEGFKDDAEAAALAATAVGTIYADTTAGIAGTTSGDYFFVQDGGNLDLYLNSSGSAVQQPFTYLGEAAVNEALTDAQAALLAADDAAENLKHDDRFLARIADRGVMAGTIDAYVDPAFSGTSLGTYEAPWTTLADAVSNTAAGDTIALTGETPGGTPYVYQPATISTLASRNVIAYGAGGKAVIEGTTDLSGNTWTLDSDGVYFTTYTRQETTKPGAITGSNVTLPQVFYLDTPLAWVRGGGTQAANTTSLKAAESGFCYTRDGGTAEDILADSTTTAVKVEVKLPGGIDPNGLDVRGSTRSKATNFGPYKYNDIIVRGGDSKDLSGVGVYTEFPRHDNFEGQNAAEHIYVGLPRIRGRFKARGAVYAGRTGASLGRSTVDAVTVYSNTDNGNYDCYIGFLDVDSCLYAMFGHGVQSFRNMTIDRISAVNLQNVISGLVVDTGGGAGTRDPVYTGTFTIGELYARDVDQLLDVAGNMVVSGVDCLMEDTPINATRQDLLVFQGTAPTITISGSWTFGLTAGTGISNFVMRRNTDATHSEPLAIFDACTDNSSAGNKGRLSRGGITNEVRVVVKNGSSLGSLLDQATGTNYPTSFYLGAGCTSGMGDRTGPEIDTALAAAGLVEDEALALAGTSGYFYLDPQSTIINRDDTVASAAGWK